MKAASRSPSGSGGDRLQAHEHEGDGQPVGAHAVADAIPASAGRRAIGGPQACASEPLRTVEGGVEGTDHPHPRPPRHSSRLHTVFRSQCRGLIAAPERIDRVGGDGSGIRASSVFPFSLRQQAIWPRASTKLIRRRPSRRMSHQIWTPQTDEESCWCVGIFSVSALLSWREPIVKLPTRRQSSPDNP